MPDSNLTISVSANTTELRASLAVAESAMRDFNRQLTAAARTARSAGDDLALTKLRDTAAQVERQTSVVAGLKTQMEAAAASSRVLSNTVQLNTAGMMELKAAGVNAFQALASGMDVTRVAMTEGAQVLGALVQGGVRLTGVLALTAAGAVAAAAGIGFLALRAYEAQKNLLSLQAELALTGRGNFSPEKFGADADEVAKKWNLRKDDVVAAMKQIFEQSKALNDAQLKAATDLAAKEAVIRNVPISETAEKYNIKNAQSAIALANSYNIATVEEERLLKAGNALGAINSVLEKLKTNLDANGGAAAQFRAELEKIKPFGEESGIERIGQMLGILDSKRRTTPVFGGVPGTTEDILRQHGAQETGGTERLSDPLNKLAGVNADLIAAVKEATKALPEGWRAQVISGTRSGARVGGGEHAADAAGGRAIDVQLYDAAGRPVPNRVGTPPGSDAYKAYQTMGNAFVLGSRGAGRWGGNFTETDIMHFGNAEGFPKGSRAGPNSPEQTKLDEEKATRLTTAEYARRAIEHRHSLELQVQDAEKFHAEMLEKHHKDSQQEIDSATDVRQKKAALYDAETQSLLAALKARQAATRDSAEKISLQNQIIGLVGSRGAAGGGVDRRAVQSETIQLRALEREAAAESIQRRIQANERLKGLDDVRAQEFAAGERLKVVRGQQTQEQALQNEADFGNRMLGEQIARLQALATTSGLTDAELEKLRDGIARLGAERTTKAVESLASQAQAAKVLTDKWAAPIRQALDNVGSSFESAFTGILTRQKTWSQAMADIGNAATSSLVSSAGSLLSKLGAKSLGATAGEGLGEFAGNQLMKSVGFGDLLGVGGQSANTAAITANTAALFANTAALGGAAAASAAGGAASAAGSVAGGAASAGGSIFSWIGKLLPFSSFNYGGIVSAAGGWALPSFPGAKPAMLHSREMVLPAHISEGIQSAIAGGGFGGGGDAHFHFHGPADAPAMDRWYKNLVARNPQAMRDVWRNNRLTPRSF